VLQPKPDDKEDVDETLAHISSRIGTSGASRKGKVEQIEWDEGIDELSREKAAAEATWGTFIKLFLYTSCECHFIYQDLTSRFRAKSERLRGKPVIPVRDRKTGTLSLGETNFTNCRRFQQKLIPTLRRFPYQRAPSHPLETRKTKCRNS
jgi:hypothetical protein